MALIPPAGAALAILDTAPHSTEATLATARAAAVLNAAPASKAHSPMKH